MSKHTPRHAAPRAARRGLASLGTLSLVGGGSLLGVAAMAPSANAATQLVYTCNTAVGAQDVTVKIDSNAPASGTVGSAITVSTVSGSITLPGSLGYAMAGALGFKSVSVTTPNTVTVAGPGVSKTQDVQLNTAKTAIYGSSWVNDGTYGGFPSDGHLVLPLAGSPNTTMTPEAAGSYTISAPDSFTSTFVGYKADGSTEKIESPCTYKSGDKVVDSITVAAAPTSTTSAPSTTSTTSAPSTTSTTSAPSSSSTSSSSSASAPSSPSSSTTSSSTSSSTSSTTSAPSTTTSSSSSAPSTTSTASSTSSTSAPTSSTATSTSAPSSTSTAAPTNSTSAPSSTSSASGSTAGSTSAPSSSTTSTTAAPTGAATSTPSAPSKPTEGPKVQTDLLAQKDGLNVLGIGFAAAGVVALGGAAFMGRRRSA